MKNKFFALCAIACAACGLNACEDGEHENLECDASYVAECLDTGHMMSCQSGKLIVTKCANGTYCKSQNGAAAMCAPISDSSNAPVPSQCSHSGAQCQGNSVVVCANGQIISSTPCTYGCDSATNVCKLQPVEQECTPGEKKCGTSLMQCGSDGKWMYAECACEDDPVEGPKCAGSEPEKCTPGEKKCAGTAGLAVCNNKGEWDYADCICEDNANDGPKCAGDQPQPVNPCDSCTDNQVCKNGGCVDIPAEIEVSDVAECESDEDCADGLVCAAKACVPKGMLEANIGDPCPEDWYKTAYYEACDADGNARYCAYDDDDNVVLQIENCLSECRMAYVSSDESYRAVCDVPASASCFEEGEKINYCDVIEDASGDFAYSSYYLCLPATDGKFAAVDMAVWDDYSECSGLTCTADGSACEGGAMPTSCEFETKCDGNVYSYCYDLGIFGIFQDSKDCSEDGMVCDTISGESSCFKPCSDSSAVNYACLEDEDDGSLSLAKTECKDFGDGKVYEVTSRTACGNACDAEAGACKVLEVGAQCDEASFVPECIGNSLTKCDNGVVAIDEDCAASGNVCAVFQGEGYCLGACNEAAAETEGCQELNGAGAYLELECTPDDNGQLVWDIVGGHYCSSHVCANDKECQKLVEDEGSDCDYKTHSDACRDGILVTCNDENILEAQNCAFDDAVCGVLADGYGEGIDYAKCFVQEEACEEEGAQMNVCTDSMFFSYISNLECYNTTAGMFYIANHIDYCADYCTDETSCEILEED